MTLTTAQAETILHQMKPFHGDAKYPHVQAPGADFWEVHPSRLIDNGVDVEQLGKDHGADFYCGIEPNARGEQVAVFMRSRLEKFIACPTTSVTPEHEIITPEKGGTQL